MATLNEIVYNIALQKGKADDTVLLSRLKFMVGYYRALFIRQDQRRNHSLPTHFIQTLECLEMEKSSAAECCTTLDIGCDVWKTKKPLPKPIRVYDGADFGYVGTIDGKEPYQRTTGVQASYGQHNKYTSNFPQYLYTNDYLYVINATPSSILVRGIFESPEDLDGYLCCDGEPVYSAEKDYPISMDMVQRITQSILGGELQLEQPHEDETDVQLGE
jgi:hypothetical protein